MRYDERQGKLQILVVGGSLGAVALNENLPAALALIPKEARPRVIHQAGEKHLAALQKNYADLGLEADIHSLPVSEFVFYLIGIIMSSGFETSLLTI